MPAGYTLDKTMYRIKETGYYTVANVKGNNVRMAIQLIQELQVYYPITQLSNMTAHIALMAIDGLLILLIVDNVVI